MVRLNFNWQSLDIFEQIRSHVCRFVFYPICEGNNVYQMEPKVTMDQVADVMEEIGFGNSAKGTGKDRAADANMGVTTYSGGWKMKMQLCVALR